jgi:hypothetical protein
MDPGGSLPYLDESATGRYSEPDKSSPHTLPSYFFELCFSIILPLTPTPSKWAPSSRFPLCFLPFHACPSRSPGVDHLSNICGGAQYMNLITRF